MSARLRLRYWVASQAYVWGLSSGAMLARDEVRIFWRGKRIYFLRWPRWKWRCLLRFHHWPTDHPVAFGEFCGKCCPWPCCGAITVEHAPGCTEEVP